MPTIILSSLTTKKAAIKKYLDFLGFELVTMIFAAKLANHWTREPSCQWVDLKDAISAEGHLLIQNLHLILVFCFYFRLIGEREGDTQPVMAIWCQKKDLEMREKENVVVFVFVYYSQTKVLRAAKLVPLDSAGSIYPRLI